jgi:hypothetical protein
MAAGCRTSGAARPPGRREAEGRSRRDRRRGLEVDRGRGQLPYGVHHGLRRFRHAARHDRRGTGHPRGAARPSMMRLEAEYAEADELPDEVDQRLGRDRTGAGGLREPARATSRPTSPSPVCSSASTPTALDRRSRLCPPRGRATRPNRSMAKVDAGEVPTVSSGDPRASRAARRHHHRRPAGRRRMRTRTTPSSRCPSAWSAS